MFEHPMVRELIGCDFGDDISIPGVDDKPCQKHAVQKIVIHAQGTAREFKFCSGHAKLVLDLTTPHE